jgi:hypothetical protein
MGRRRRYYLWSGPELRTIRAYARACVRGKYRGAVEAARAYVSDMMQLRRKYPQAQWLRFRRSFQAVHAKLDRRLRELGNERPLVRYSVQEKRLFDRLARQLVEGAYRRIEDAAHVFLDEMERRRRRFPRIGGYRHRRTLKAAKAQLNLRTLALGRIRCARWFLDEERVVRRYAQAVLEGRYNSAVQAVGPCREELVALYRRHPAARWAHRIGTREALHHRIQNEAAAQGGRWRGTEWSRPEQRVAERYARALVQGRYSKLTPAAILCARELDHLRKKYPARRAYTARRTLKSVMKTVRLTANRMGRSARRSPTMGIGK